MNIEEISSEWEKDNDVDISMVSEISKDIPLLHNKYYKEFSKERFKLKSLELDLKKLRLDKYEFYTQGPNETTPDHWSLPAIGRVIKSEVQQYIDTDPDVVKLTLKIAAQIEKVDYLESIIKLINNRSFHLKNIVEWERFKNGG